MFPDFEQLNTNWGTNIEILIQMDFFHPILNKIFQIFSTNILFI